MRKLLFLPRNTENGPINDPSLIGTLTLSLKVHSCLERAWYTGGPGKSTERETEAGAVCNALAVRSGSLTSPAVLAKAMRSRLGDQTRKMISCGSCFSPTTRKDGKQVGKRNMGAAPQ